MIDAITKLFSGPYLELAEQATSEYLLGPDLAQNMLLSDQANLKRYNAREIMKAIERRIGHKNTKVQFLTLNLIMAIVQNGVPHVHVELAKNTNVLNHIYEFAVRPIVSDGDCDVKSEAIKLALSLEVWFQGIGGQELTPLRQIADRVRHAGGMPETFTMDVLPLTGPTVHRPPRTLPSRADIRNLSQSRDRSHSSADLTPEHMDAMLEAVNLLISILNDTQNAPSDLILDLAGQVHQHHSETLRCISNTSHTLPEGYLDLLLQINEAQSELLERIQTIGENIISNNRLTASSTNTNTNNNILDDLFTVPAVQQAAQPTSEEDREFAEFAASRAAQATTTATATTQPPNPNTHIHDFDAFLDTNLAKV